MTYWWWLAGLSLLFIGLERWRPRHAGQKLLREGLAVDLVYVVFNGHWLGVGLALLARPVAQRFDPLVTLDIASGWPLWVQFPIAFIGIDLMQWCIHNLLHRVSFLWEVHKVHHSIHTMDFWGSMRFHFGEIVVYKTLQYVPLALLGFSPDVMFAIAVIGTAIGHFNHANLNVRLGPLRYVLNSPEMHVWHHAHASVGPINVNFGINLAVWDWLFATAYIGSEPPRRLGFVGDERFPRDVVRQELWPLKIAQPPVATGTLDAGEPPR